jgi:hypothetical protein
MNEKLRALYDNLIKDNYELPSYDIFTTDMADENKSKALHDNLLKDNYDVPDYDTFSNDLGLKKKDISLEGLASGQSVSQMLGTAPKEPLIQPQPLQSAKPKKVDYQQTLPKDITLSSIGEADKNRSDYINSEALSLEKQAVERTKEEFKTLAEKYSGDELEKEKEKLIDLRTAEVQKAVENLYKESNYRFIKEDSKNISTQLESVLGSGMDHTEKEAKVNEIKASVLSEIPNESKADVEGELNKLVSDVASSSPLGEQFILKKTTATALKGIEDAQAKLRIDYLSKFQYPQQSPMGGGYIWDSPEQMAAFTKFRDDDQKLTIAKNYIDRALRVPESKEGAGKKAFQNELHNILTAGFSGLIEDITTAKAASGQAKGVKNEADEAILTTYGLLQNLNQIASESVPRYRRATSVAGSLPYMEQFLLTGGIGTGASATATNVGKAILGKSIRGRLAKELVKRVVQPVVEASISMIGRVPLSPATYSNIAKESIGILKQEDGKFVVDPEKMPSIAEAIGTGTYNSAKDIFSESLGGMVDIGLPTFLNRAVSPNVRKFFKQAGINGIHGELYEEMISQSLGGENPFDPEFLKDLILTIPAITAGFASLTVPTIGSNMMLRANNKEVLDTFGKDNVANIRELIEKGDETNLINTIEQLSQGVDKKDVRNLLRYSASLVQEKTVTEMTAPKPVEEAPKEASTVETPPPEFKIGEQSFASKQELFDYLDKNGDTYTSSEQGILDPATNEALDEWNKSRRIQKAASGMNDITFVGQQRDASDAPVSDLYNVEVNGEQATFSVPVQGTQTDGEYNDAVVAKKQETINKFGAQQTITDTAQETIVEPPVVEITPVQEEVTPQRTRVRQQIISTDSTVTEEQADATMSVFDAQAKVFADTLGKTTEDYYSTLDIQGEMDAVSEIKQAQKEGKTVKGAFRFVKGRNIATLMKKGDVSTLLHEVAGHRGRRLLTELATADKGWSKRLSEVEAWAGVKDGKWTVPAEEKFARAFEGYVRNGTLPKSAPQALKEAFEKLKEWMKAIYADPKIFDTLDPKVKKTFDALLGVTPTKGEKKTKTIGPTATEMEGDALFQKASIMDEVWSGVVDLTTGEVNSTYTYKQAKDNDFHHSFLVGDYYDAIDRGEKAYFWIGKDGNPMDMQNSLSDAIKRKIKSQLKLTPKLLTEQEGDALFQTAKVEREVQVNKKNKGVKVFEVSIQPQQIAGLEDGKTAKGILTLDEARTVNTNPERIKDWEQIYSNAGTFGVDKLKKQGDWKLEGVPIIDLTQGCMRATVSVERVENGVLPKTTRVESCYGGTCWVNLTFTSMFGKFENMEVRDIEMIDPKVLDSFVAKNKAFLTQGYFIRHGQRGDDSHAFATGLAIEWLKAMQKHDVTKNKEGNPLKNIFISASYAPVTEEQYKAMLPYKDLFTIHFSNSGWFHENEIMIRLAEYQTAKKVGLDAKIRLISNKDGISGVEMANEQLMLDKIKEMGIPNEDILETPYHDDGIKGKKQKKRSDASGLFKNVCCESGKCATCGPKCMSRIVNKESLVNIRAEHQRQAQEKATEVKGPATALTDTEEILFQEGDNKPYQEFSDKMAIKAEKDALKNFPTTEDWRVTGWLTISGNQLDFSGNDRGAWGRERSLDHREVNEFMSDYDLGKYDSDKKWIGSNSTGMLAFMDMGNIRVSPESKGLGMHVMPSNEQFRGIRNFIDTYHGEVIIDFGDIASIEYPKWIDQDKIVDDIKAFYKEGTIPTAEGEALWQEETPELEKKRETKLAKDTAIVQKNNPELKGKELQDAVRKQFLSDISQPKHEKANAWLDSNDAFNGLLEAPQSTQTKTKSTTPQKKESVPTALKEASAEGKRKPLGAQENSMIQMESEEQQRLTDIIDENKEYYNTLDSETVLKNAHQYIEEAGSIDNATRDLEGDTRSLNELPTRQVARMILIDHYMRVLGNRQSSQQEKNNAFRASTNLQSILAKEANKAGQANVHLKLWKVMQPAGLLEFTKRHIADFNKKKLSKTAPKSDKTIGQLVDILYGKISEENKKIIDDILEGKAIEGKMPKEAKEGKPKIKREPAKKKTVPAEQIKAEKDYRKNLLDQYRKNQGKTTLQAGIPLTAEQIELGGNLIASYVREGYYRLADIVEKLKKDLASININITDDKELDPILSSKKEGTATYRSWLREQEAKVGLGEELKSLKIRISDVVKMHWTERDALGRSLAQKLVDDAGLTESEAKKLEEAVLAEYNKQITERLSSYKELTDMLGKEAIPGKGKKVTMFDKLLQTLNMGALNEPLFRGLFAEKFGLADNINDEQAMEIMRLANAVQQMVNKGWFYRDAVMNLAKYLYELQPKTKFNEWAETWIALSYAHMLSGIPTSLLNLWSSGSNMALKPVRDAVNLSKWFRAIKGRVKEGTPLSGEIYIPFGEMFYLPVLQGMSHGAKEAAEIYVNGDLGSKYIEEIKSSTQFKVSQLERNKYGKGKRFKPIRVKGVDVNVYNLEKYVGRNLSAQDRLMFNTAFEMAVADILRRKLVNPNLKGRALTKAVMDAMQGAMLNMEALNAQIEQEAAEYKELTGHETTDRQKAIRMRELIVKSLPISEEEKQDAEAIARGNIFTDDRGGLVATAANAIGRLANSKPMAGMVIKPFIPFTKIVGNVTEYMLDHTPFYGLMRANGWGVTGIAKRVTGHEGLTSQMGLAGSNIYYEQMGRAWLGTVSFLMLAAMFIGNDDDDDIQISGGYNQEGFKKGGRENIMPKYTIRIKGVDISYLNIPALAIPLGIIGNTNDALKMNISEDELGDRITAGLLLESGMKTFLMVKDMSFVTGVQNLLTMVTDATSMEESNWKRVAQTMAKTYIGFGLRPLPQNTALLQQTFKFFDPASYSQKDIKSILAYSAGLQHFFNKPTIDQLGDEVTTYPGERLLPYTHWFNIKGNDPRWRFLADQNAVPTKLDNRRVHVETKEGAELRTLDTDEFFDYTKTAGKFFSDKLTAYMADSARVAKRQEEKTEIEGPKGEPILTTGVQQDINKLWAESKKDAYVSLFRWYDFKETNPKDWQLMVDSKALQEPITATVKIEVGKEEVELTKTQMTEYNQLAMEQYHKYVIKYLQNTDRVAKDKKRFNPITGKSFFDERIDRDWTDAKAAAENEMYKQLRAAKAKK